MLLFIFIQHPNTYSTVTVTHKKKNGYIILKYVEVKSMTVYTCTVVIPSIVKIIYAYNRNIIYNITLTHPCPKHYISDDCTESASRENRKPRPNIQYAPICCKLLVLNILTVTNMEFDA